MANSTYSTNLVGVIFGVVIRLRNPETGDFLKQVYVTGIGWYGYNPDTNAYHNVQSYRKLEDGDVPNIDYAAPTVGEE